MGAMPPSAFTTTSRPSLPPLRSRRSERGMREQFISAYRRNAAHLAARGLYDPAEEHDACGVGLIAALDGKPRRQVVEAAIAALKAVWHRGAVDADGKTGDG